MVINVCIMTLSHYPLSTACRVIIHNPGIQGLDTMPTPVVRKSLKIRETIFRGKKTVQISTFCPGFSRAVYLLIQLSPARSRLSARQGSGRNMKCFGISYFDVRSEMVSALLFPSRNLRNPWYEIDSAACSASNPRKPVNRDSRDLSNCRECRCVHCMSFASYFTCYRHCCSYLNEMKGVVALLFEVATRNWPIDAV
jgi:hypothetical protein